MVQQDLAYFQVFSNGKKLCLKYQSVENNQEHVSNSLFNMYNFQILFKIHHFDWSCWFVITNLKFITKSLRKLTWSNHQVHPRCLCRVFDLNSQKYVKGLPEIKKKHGSRKIIINPLVFLCRQASGKNVTLSSSLTFH